MPKHNFKQLGIKSAQPKAGPYSYITPFEGQRFAGKDILKRSQYGAEFLNNTPIESMNPVVGANPSSPINANNITELSQAISQNNVDLVGYDIETLGNSKYSLQGTNRSPFVFDAPQVTLQRYKRNEKELVMQEALNLAVGVSDDTQAKMARTLKELEVNPLKWAEYDKDKRRSVIDLMLYSNEKNFSKETIGDKVVKTITGQSKGLPSVDASPLEIRNYTSQMRRGLSNLTNTNLVNTKEEALSAFNLFTKPTDTFFGYNNTVFDRPGLFELYGEAAAGTPFGNQFFGRPQLDVLTLAQQTLKNNPNYNQASMKLEDVSAYFFGREVQSHFAGEDVKMTAKVLSAFSEETIPGLNVNPFEVNPDGVFVATKGVASNPSAFNLGENNYSFTYRENPKTGKFEVATPTYQPNPVLRNNEYQFLGTSKGPVIDGIQQHGFALKDLSTDNISLVFSPNENYMTDKFTQGIFSSSVDMSKSQRDYFKVDTTRRAYDRLFDANVNYISDDPVKRIEDTYTIIDEYKDMLQTNPISKGQDENEYIKRIYDRHLEGYRLGRTSRPPSQARIRDAVRLTPILEEERPVWQQAIQRINQDFPVSASSDQYRQNLQHSQSIRNVAQEIRNNYEVDPNFRFGAPGSKIIDINLNVQGEAHYLNATTSVEYNRSVGNILRRKPTESNGEVQRKFNILFNKIEVENPENSVVLSELKHKVQQDIQKFGEIQNSTINDISIQTYPLLKDSQSIQPGVKGNQFQARSLGYYTNEKYSNRLRPYTSDFNNEIVDKAISQVVNNSQNKAIGQDIYLSKELAQKIQVNNEVINTMNSYYENTQLKFGMDQGEIEKAKRNLNFKHANVEETIKETIKEYERQNFNVALVMNDTRGTAELLYIPSELNISLGNMNYTEAIQNPNVGVQTLPLMGGTYAMDTNVGTVTTGFDISIKHGANGPEALFQSSQQVAFDEIKSSPKRLRSRIRREEKLGSIDYHDILSGEASSIERKISSGRAYSAFSTVTPLEDVSLNSSQVKNLITSGQLNTSPIIENYLLEQNPELYNKWYTYKESNSVSSVFDAGDFWYTEARYGDAPKLRDIELRAVLDFKQQTGISLNFSGVSTSARGRGAVTLGNAQDMTSLAWMDSRRRETIVKSMNILPMNKEEATRYSANLMNIRYGHLAGEALPKNSRMTQRIVQEAQIMGNALLDYNGSSSRNILNLNVRAMQANSEEIQKLIQPKVNALDKEIVLFQEQLKAIDITNGETSEYKEVQKRMNKLIQDRNIYYTLAPHEGQSVISQSLANSILTESTKEVILGVNEEIPESLLELIAQQEGIEYVPGQSLGIAAGEVYELDGYYDIHNLKEMGLVDKDGKLTVGEIALHDATLEGQEYSTRQATSKRLDESAELVGITKDRDGRSILQFEERATLKSGDKLLVGQGGLRTKVEVVEDRILRDVGITQDIIFEYSKVGRDNPGANILTYINTVQDNLLEEIEGIDFASLNSIDDLGDEVLPGVKGAITSLIEEGAEIQELNVDTVYDKAFLPLAENFGLTTDGYTPSLIRNDDTGRYDITRDIDRNQFIGQEGQENYRRFIQESQELAGLSEKDLSVPIAIHNTGNYSGTATKPTITFREMELEAMRRQDIYGSNDAYSTYEDVMNRLYRDGQYQTGREYSQRISKVLNMTEETIQEQVKQSGNVIFDMSGKFTADKNQNFYIDGNGRYVVDGRSLNRSGGVDSTRSFSNTNSITLFNDNIEGFEPINLDTFLEENNAQAFLKTQPDTASFFDQTYVPVIGNIDPSGDNFSSLNPRQMDKDLQQMANASMEAYDATSVTAQSRASLKGNKAARAYYEDAQAYLTGSKPGGTVKSTMSYQTQQGMSARSGVLNPAFAEAKQNLRANNQYLNRQDAREMIRGIEDNILTANEITEEILGDTNKVDFILDRMADLEDDTFQVFAVTNRNPNQTTGNIQTMNLKVLDGVNSGTSFISPEIAPLFSADYDGDQLYSYADFYLDGATNSPDELVSLQQDLRVRSDYANQQARASGSNYASDINQSYMQALTEDINVGQFKNRDTILEMIEDNVTSEIIGQKVGQTDNLRMKQLTQVNEVLESHLNNGSIAQDTADRIRNSLQYNLSDTLQSSISSKKITAETIGIHAGQTQEEMLSAAEAYRRNYDEFLSGMNYPSYSKKDRTIELGQQLDIFSSNTDELLDISNMYDYMAETQDIYKRAGIDTSTARIGLSSGLELGSSFNDALGTGDFGNLLLTDRTEEMVRNVAPEFLDQHNEARRAMQQRLASMTTTGGVFSSAVEDVASTIEPLGREASDQLSEITRRSAQNSAYNKLLEESKVTNTLKDSLGRTMGSSAFRAGAGAMAGWMLVSAIKKAPTPEGEEAEQEATAMEVAPAAMLTSPTARVTPLGENITLNISGRGRVDNQEIAGIINQQLSEQTQSYMDMNLTQSDNTQTLDSRFYEEKISQALGL